MMNYHQRLFGQDPDSFLPESDINAHNKRILKRMVLLSPFSSAMLGVVIIMYLTCMVTDIVNNRFKLDVISSRTLLQFGANSSQLVYLSGQKYRLITAMFLHAGLMHIAMNSFSFLMYLMPVQQKLKNYKLYALVLFFGGILGNCCSVDITLLRNKSILAVGASTSICSVIGFDMIYRILHVDNMPLNSRRIMITFGYIFVISLLPGVDFWGHFGSLFAGMLIGTAFLPPSSLYWSSKQIKVIKILGGLGLLGYSLLLIIPLF